MYKNSAYRKTILAGLASMAFLAVAISTIAFVALIQRSRHMLTDEPATSFVYKDTVHKVLWAKRSVNARTVQLDDIFISVKTSAQFHDTRVRIILDTWFKTAADQTWFFSDSDDFDISSRSNGHLVNTRCPPTHNRQALNCKMAAEIAHFLASQKRWFCHFDDDNYVNVDALLGLLQDFPADQAWYLGKTSVKDPLEVMERPAKPLKRRSKAKKASFRFATGGAGFCLSRPVVMQMHEQHPSLVAMGESIRLPDDVTVGFVVEHKLGVPLTKVANLHSHLEPLNLIPKETIRDQISLSYSEGNSLNIEGLDVSMDWTRFYSIHCFLRPNSIKECSQI